MGAKSLTFVRRRPELSPQQFHEAWRVGHEAFWAGDAAARALVTRVELLHRLPEDYERERHPGEMVGPQWDGVVTVEHTTPGEADALAALGSWQAFDAHERATIRTGDLASVLTGGPTIIVDKPGGRARAQCRLVCILRRNAALDHATFHQHWREHHGGLFQTIAELNEPLLAYDQNHGLDRPGAAYDGVTEQWFASVPEWIESLGVASHHEVVEPDVAYFLDPTSVQFILAGPPTVVVGP